MTGQAVPVQQRTNESIDVMVHFDAAGRMDRVTVFDTAAEEWGEAQPSLDAALDALRRRIVDRVRTEPDGPPTTLTYDAAALPLDPDDWRRQEHVWWVWDRQFGGRLQWNDWTFSVTEPPLSHGQISNRCGWRHPTFEEACYRQEMFATLPRSEWERRVDASYVNRQSIDPSHGRSLVFTDGGRELEAEERLEARRAEVAARYWDKMA